jgi:DNA-binding GntR family transcriptional regulator
MQGTCHRTGALDEFASPWFCSNCPKHGLPARTDNVRMAPTQCLGPLQTAIIESLFFEESEMKAAGKSGDKKAGDKKNPVRLAESAYAKIKSELFDFSMMPGERVSENDIAQRLGMSRTPIREALYRLGQEGFIQVASKSGWTVRSFDFAYFDNLYDLRVVIETAAVRRLCERVPMPDLAELRAVWLVAPESRLVDGAEVSLLDEEFHATLARECGNAELARVHADITERIRVIRRLDFMYPERIRSTYAEHAQILRGILRRKSDQASLLLKAHIDESKAEVRKISLHKLFEAKAGGAAKAHLVR